MKSFLGNLIKFFKSDRIKDVWTVILLFAAIHVGYIYVCNNGTDKKTIQLFMLLACLFAFILYFFISGKEDKKYKSMLSLIITVGCIMRIGFCLYNGFFDHAHDMWYINDFSSDSKGTYLGFILINHQLPSRITGQLYQQPLSYFASAVSCWIVKPFLNTDDWYYIGGAAKLSNCLFSCLTLILTSKLSDIIKVKKYAKVITVSIIAFMPSFYLLGGTLSEDMLSCFIILLEIYLTIKYSKDPTFKNIIILAITYGLGLLTSLRCILPVFYTLILLAERIIVYKNTKKDVFRTVSFFAVTLCLGIGGYLRNLIMFGVPFTYFYTPGEGNWTWTADRNLLDRLGFFSLKNIKSTPYVNPDEDCNLITYFTKTELFGEFGFEISEFLPYILLYIDIIFTIFVIVMIIWRFKAILKNKFHGIIMLVTLGFGLAVMLFYLLNPFSGFMDSRYFQIMVILKALMFGMTVAGYLPEKIKKIRFYAANILLSLFAASSILIFCLI